MRVRDYNYGYVIVTKNYWIKYRLFAFIDRWASTLEEARYVKNSLEREDKMSFLIISCKTKGEIE